MINPLDSVIKETYREQVNSNLKPHEAVLEMCGKIKIPGISNRVPLDTSQNAVIIHGKTYAQYLTYLQSISETLQKGHTLQAKVISADRQTYNYREFFVSPDGWYVTPKDALALIIQSFTRLAQQCEVLDASTDKDYTAKYNLKLLQSILLVEMIEFLESIYRESNLPTDQIRDI